MLETFLLKIVTANNVHFSAHYSRKMRCDVQRAIVSLYSSEAIPSRIYIDDIRGDVSEVTPETFTNARWTEVLAVKL